MRAPLFPQLEQLGRSFRVFASLPKSNKKKTKKNLSSFLPFTTKVIQKCLSIFLFSSILLCSTNPYFDVSRH